MKPVILVLNSGSSSIKFSLIETNTQTTLYSGIAEKLGLPGACIHFKNNGEVHTINIANCDHEQAMQAILTDLEKNGMAKQITAIGHRVVHGGEWFKSSTLINDEVIKVIEKCIPFAPLHNPANLVGIQAALHAAPTLPQVAVFDTAFHQALQQHSYLYAVPMSWYEQFGVRRYGFHGTSHQFVSEEAARFLNIPLENSAFVTAHLGNGASAAAILNGHSVDTSMGFTPLEGLVMGTRSGDIDPGLHTYIAEKLNVSVAEVIDMLNKKSGLLGLSGLTSDIRELTQAAAEGHKGAQLAIEVFCFHIAKYIGALTVSLPRVDALVFTGGIGENSVLIREKVLSRLGVLGYHIDNAANEAAIRGKQGIITTANSVKALVINTNEELMIAKETVALI